MMSGQEDADEVVGKVTSLSSSEQTNSFVIAVLDKVSNLQTIKRLFHFELQKVYTAGPPLSEHLCVSPITKVSK